MLSFIRFTAAILLLIITPQSSFAADNSDRDKSHITSETTQRIISLAPHITELIYAAGGGEYLIGVSAYSDYPQAAQELPVVGDAFRIDLERLLLLEADAVFYWQGNTSLTVMQQLEKQGLNLIPVEINNLADISINLRMIAERLALPIPVSAELIENELTRLNKFKRPSRRLLIQLSEQPIYTVSGDHWMSEAAALCGLTNIFPSLMTSAATVSKEAVIVANPEVIIRTQEITDNSPLSQWPQIDAIKNNQIVVLDPDTFSRPTPRIIKAIEYLCHQVDQFTAATEEAESSR